MFDYETTQTGPFILSNKKASAMASSLLLRIVPTAVVGAFSLSSLPALSQTVPPIPNEAVDEAVSETICTYDPNVGMPNPLGERASLTIKAAGSSTNFIYERLPAIVSSDSSTTRAEVDNKRTLTLYETSVAEARQLLLDDSTYYAVLLGLAPDDPFVARGFETINRTLTCTEGGTAVDDIETLNPLVPQPLQPPVQ